MKTRIKEVDGLRAIALIAVLLFHAKLGKFVSGGFLGVDVFFVISGYVISLSLLRQIEADKFSFREFFIRRILRLVPPLLFTLFMSNLFSIWASTAEHRMRTADLSLSSLLSVSNFHLLFQSDYFDVSGRVKPYLHTWSLSVEWQFYLSWALISKMIYSFCKTKNSRLTLICVLAATSLVFSEFYVRKYPTRVFYMVYYRYAEFMCGAIPAWNHFHNVKVHNEAPASRTNYYLLARNAISVLFISFVILAFAKFDETMTFPGLSAIPVCLSTGIIICTSSGTIVGNVFLNPVIQYLGKISYSVYLVHWPILVFLEYEMFYHSTEIQRVMAIGSSISIGFVLYHTVEKQFLDSRKRDTRYKRPTKLLFVAISGLVFGCQVAVMKSSALPLGPTARTLRNKTFASIFKTTSEFSLLRYRGIRRKCKAIGPDSNLENFKKCNPPSRSEIVLIGDSHALDLWFTLNHTFPDSTIIQITGPGCGLHQKQQKKIGCRNLLKEYPDYLTKRINRVKAVVMVSNWNGLTHDILQTSYLNSAINFFKANSTATIYVLGPRPHFKPDPIEVFERERSPDLESRIIRTNDFMTQDHMSDRNLYQFTRQKNVTYISVTEAMCNATRIGQPANQIYCSTLSIDGSALIYVDGGHYNSLGASMVLKPLKQKIAKLL